MHVQHNTKSCDVVKMLTVNTSYIHINCYTPTFSYSTETLHNSIYLLKINKVHIKQDNWSSTMDTNNISLQTESLSKSCEFHSVCWSLVE